MPGEQLGEQPQHDLPVLQHVGDAGGRARIVLEDVERVGVASHDVDPGDVDVDAVRHRLPIHLRTEHRVLEHQILRHHAGAQDFTAAVDVGDEHVHRLDALLQSGPKELPFGGGKDARNDVERDQPLLRIGMAVDREGDADAPEQELGLLAAVIEHSGRNFLEPAAELGIGRAHRPVGPGHLIERNRHRAPTRPRAIARPGASLAASHAPKEAARMRPNDHAGGMTAQLLGGG